VPLEDVLVFKERHRNQLHRLRWHFEELAAKVARDGFDPAVVRTEIEKLDSSIAEHVDEARKSNHRLSLGGLKLSMNWLGAPLAIGTALSQGLPLTTGLIGATVASISLSSERGLKRSQSTSPFAYLATIERDFR
jgi:hypothetical protein